MQPELEQFSIRDYGADNQNWGVDIAENGTIYFANNKGLLQYNGEQWRLFELPNKTIVRSVFVENDTIYTGSYEEFGYWKADTYGILQYTSLSDLFEKDSHFTSDEFWQIVKYQNDILFWSFSGIYIYDGKQIRKVDNSQDVSNITIYQGRLIVGCWQRGLQELVSDKLLPLDWIPLPSPLQNITNIASFDTNALFFYDLQAGGFIYSNHRLNPLPQKINQFLKNNILNKTLFVSAEKIAFGTIKNGILLYDWHKKTTKYINKSSGLQNNTILGLASLEGQLWCALDNGLARINLGSPFSYYKDYTGLLGTVYDLVYYNQKIFLASNTGVYTFDQQQQLQFIQGSEGHAWNLSILNGQLFCGHNKGTYLFRKDRFEKIGQASEGVYSFHPIPGTQEQYLLGTYIGLSLLRKEAEKWVTHPIQNIEFPVDKITYETNTTIWATHPYKGLYKIALRPDYRAAIDLREYSNHAEFTQYKTKIYRIDARIVFYNSNQWFQYQKATNRIEPFALFEKYRGKRLIRKQPEGWLFVEEDGSNGISYHHKTKPKIIPLDAAEIRNRLVSKYEKLFIQNDSLGFLNLNDGFAVIDIPKLYNRQDRKAPPPIFDRIYSNKKQYGIDSKLLEIPFAEAQSLSFELYTPTIVKANHFYTLHGRLSHLRQISKGKLTLQNLPYGNYSLSIFNKEDTKRDRGTTLNFKILPPWYLSNFALFGYFLLLLAIIFAIYRMNQYRVRKQQLALKKLHIRKTQRRISQLEKENLEKELKSKQRELINSTDSVIRKNEIIMVLQNELERLLALSPNSSRTKKILHSTKKDISSNNNWKVFESNFNELNGKFFKELTQIQPKLTTKDLRLCAYVKTGLTSKKIAPLMGISVRGVELHRYRLRKKLGIPNNENLSNFLTNL
ncbi:MAG: LuxR C-terminal-related transcriptional regulator [Flavobacteriaceae bacterium]|nr:LuxR C-terminal-related transcriptional regulator [Flavobacteriaceae bacterium]